jgi:methyl-accepting chemotaxis protein
VRERIAAVMRISSENEATVRDVGVVATDATQALGGILDGSRRLADVVGEAANVSRLQGRAMTELATVIAGVREVATDSAARADAAAGLAQEQHAGLDALSNTAQELARLAERLRESSSRFVVASA